MNTEKETLSTQEDDTSELTISLTGNIAGDITRLKMSFGYEDYQSVIAHILQEYQNGPVEAQQDLFYWLSLMHSVLDSLWISIQESERIFNQEQIISDMRTKIEAHQRQLAKELISA